jgi:hypothetical protein
MADGVSGLVAELDFAGCPFGRCRSSFETS